MVQAKVEPQESMVQHNQAETRSSPSPAADTVSGHGQEAQGDNEPPVSKQGDNEPPLSKHPNRAGQHQAGENAEYCNSCTYDTMPCCFMSVRVKLGCSLH